MSPGGGRKFILHRPTIPYIIRYGFYQCVADGLVFFSMDFRSPESYIICLDGELS